MQTVLDCFRAHRRRMIDKWQHYFDIYERHFRPYVGRPVRILEIGVSHGGSLQLWKAYFGPQAEIHGVDIDPRCKAYEEDQITIYTLAQSQIKGDPECQYDIVIDDGSHLPADQAASFNALWPTTKGVYLIEDCHNGYPDGLNGNYRAEAIISLYPWVAVMERPKRLIRGNPSRELRQDEIDAINLHTDA